MKRWSKGCGGGDGEVDKETQKVTETRQVLEVEGTVRTVGEVGRQAAVITRVERVVADTVELWWR